MNALCVTLDGFHSGYLGCYGNCWIETPQLDRFAARGFLFDQSLIEGADLEGEVRSVFESRHALAHAARTAEHASLMLALGTRGVRTILLTDDPQLADLPIVAQFDEVIRCDRPPADQPATSVAETQLAFAFAALAQCVSEVEGPYFIWAHFAGLVSAWDAPIALRQRYVDEGEENPPATVEVPRLLLPRDFDPDELLAIRRCYAGQILALDHCWGAFFEELEENANARDTLVWLRGCRGVALGEHEQVGPGQPRLHAEEVQVPSIVVVPGASGAAGRSQALVQTADVGATLTAWFQLPRLADAGAGFDLLELISGQRSTVRDYAALATADGSWGLRTRAWYALGKSPPSDTSGSVQLFTKPDDRWEVNEIATRCPEIAAELAQVWQQFADHCRQGSNTPLAAIDARLSQIWR